EVPGERPFSRDRGGPLPCPSSQISTAFSTVRPGIDHAAPVRSATRRELRPSWRPRLEAYVDVETEASARLGVDLRVLEAYDRQRSARSPSDVAGSPASSAARCPHPVSTAIVKSPVVASESPHSRLVSWGA